MIEHVRLALLRPQPSGYELLFVRRAGATGADFPGGAVHEGEDPRVAGARTVFEDCGILLARDTHQAATLDIPRFPALRRTIRGGAANGTELMRSHGLTWAAESLVPWSHWVTPSLEAAVPAGAQPRGASEAVRTSTRIFVAELPAGLKPVFDEDEGASAQWLGASAIEARATELQLAPMLVRTCWELARHLTVSAVFAAARRRAGELHPILPRLAMRGDSRCLLLPWDSEYETAGQGESKPFTYQPTWATGPSRFILEDLTWKHVAAPGSTSAG